LSPFSHHHHSKKQGRRSKNLSSGNLLLEDSNGGSSAACNNRTVSPPNGLAVKAAPKEKLSMPKILEVEAAGAGADPEENDVKYVSNYHPEIVSICSI
jgi:hypothetical protein